MGRELKRVPLDFSWPDNKVWEGYLNPHHKPCPEAGRTCFNGENAASQYLQQITSMLTVIGDDARRGSTHPYAKTLPYHREHPDWAVQPIEVRKRMVDLVQKLTGADPGMFGFGGSGHKIYFKLLELSGIKNEEGSDDKPAYAWGHCAVCNGENIDPAAKAAYDAWKEYEPPVGGGYQLWETTSEGSPASPVFKTLDELCAYAAENVSVFGNEMASAEKWKKMLDDGLVCHTDGNVTFL